MPKVILDWILLVPVILLSLLSLLILRSIAPQELINQSVFFILALLFFLFFAQADYRIFFSLWLPEYAFAIGFLLLPFIFGIHSRGALRWLQFGDFSLQPSEIIKPFLLIAYSVLVISTQTQRQLLLIGAFLLPALIVFFQPDLGTVLVLTVGWATVFFSRFSIRHLLTLGVLTLLLAPLGWFVLRPYQRDRLLIFIDPNRDPLRRGYHVIQSITAVGSGGLFGRGLGHGTQSQLRFLPEHHTDFIFASLSEELGFIGAMLVLALYLLFLWRLYHISQTTTDPGAAYFCLSALTMLTFQIFVNIGMNMGIAPITGITLPFLSYGGSSLLSLGILLGLLSSISTHRHSDSYFQIR